MAIGFLWAVSLKTVSVRLLAEVSTKLSLARPRLGLFRACLGVVLGSLGAVLELSWSVLGRLEAVRAKSDSA